MSLFSEKGMYKFIDKSLKWIRENKDQVMIISAVLVFLIVLLPIVINYKLELRAKVLDEVNQMQALYYQGDMENVLKIADSILNKEKKSNVAKFVLFTKGNTLYNLERYNEAELTFSSFLKKYRKDYFTIMAIDNLAYSQEMQGKYNEAIETFNKIINEYTDSYLLVNAYDGKARCLELSGNIKDAKELYQLIINMFPDTMWQERAKSRLIQLELGT